MAASNASASQLGFKTEASAGTTVTVDKFLPFTGWDITRTDPSVESDGIRADRLVRDVAESNGGNIEVAGSISGDLPVKGASTLLTHWFGTVNTTGSNPYTHAYTPGDLDSATLQAALPDGAGVKQPVTVTGAVCSSFEIAGEEGAFLTWSESVMAQRLQVGSTSLPSAATTSGSPTVTVAGLSKGMLGYDVSGTGVPAGAYIIAIADDLATCTLSANASASGTVTIVVGKALASASYPSSLSYYKMHMVTLTIGGTAVPVKGFTFGGDNKIEGRWFGGSRFSSPPTPTGELRDYTGTLNLEYASNVQLDRYFAGDPFDIQILATKGANTLTFDLHGRYDEGMVPTIGGRGRLMQDAPFHCLGDGSDADGVTVTMVNSDSSAA